MVPRAADRRRPFAILTAALLLTLVVPGAALGGAGTVTGQTSSDHAAAVRFTLDLSARGDFVAQTDFVQCVGASMQMMLNMIRSTDDRTRATQRELQILARSLSGQRPDGRQRKGAGVQGWTSGLTTLGAGAYRAVGSSQLQEALKVAARAMRDTGRPVGLLVWRGRHAWVMAGFKATADPRLTDDFKVLEVIVLDPLYPHGSTVWGASPKPRESLTVKEVGRQFVRRSTRTSFARGGSTWDSAWSKQMSGRYVIVMPYTPVRSSAFRR